MKTRRVLGASSLHLSNVHILLSPLWFDCVLWRLFNARPDQRASCLVREALEWRRMFAVDSNGERIMQGGVR